jgi:hypothetical protein
MTLNLSALPGDAATAKMNAFGVSYRPLRLPPHATSTFTGECELAKTHLGVTGRPLDFKVYYVLPHYHARGVGARVEVIGGTNDGHALYQSSSKYGEPLGKTLDDPFALTGATGVRFSCTFDNPSDEVIGWGNSDQEMCMIGMFVDSEYKWAGGVLGKDTNQVLGDTEGNGIIQNTGPCEVFGVPPNL